MNELHLNSNMVKDLTPIIECPGMREYSILYIGRNPLTDSAKNEQVKVLSDRGVNVILY